MAGPVQWRSWWHMQGSCCMKKTRHRNDKLKIYSLSSVFYVYIVRILILFKRHVCMWRHPLTCIDIDISCSSMLIIILRFFASFDNTNVYSLLWMYASIFCLCHYASFTLFSKLALKITHCVFRPSVYCFRIMVIRKVRLLFLSHMKDHKCCLLWCV